MRRTFFLSLILAALVISANLNAQILEKLKNVVSSKSSVLTEKDAANGIKEALVKGTGNGIDLVSKAGGYFNNPEIKILLPADASNMEKKLRAIGLGSQVDQVVQSLNKAAEGAAVEAKPIFVAAIKNMTITEAVNIVKGDNDAATRYLEKSTTSELNQKFQPVIKASLDKVNATKYWSKVMDTYNRIPFTKKVNSNLTEYVTDKAIDGLFVMIAKEEQSIRSDPAARTTDLLKKVFGK